MNIYLQICSDPMKGFTHVFYFYPDPWGNDPIWLAHIFQMVSWFNHQLVFIQSCHGTMLVKSTQPFFHPGLQIRWPCQRSACGLCCSWGMGSRSGRGTVPGKRHVDCQTTQKVPTEMDLYRFGMKILKMWMLIVYVLIIMHSLLHSCIVMEGGVKSYIDT